jgi:hypothetical protein
MAQTQAALYEAVHAALTSPALPYTVNNADGTYSTTTLPAANVVSRSAWLNGSNPPDPLIAFSIGSKGAVSRFLPDRELRLYVWCASTFEISARFLYEAVRARINFADQEGGDYAGADLSRAATSRSLPLVMRSCEEIEALPCEFDRQTGRWYVTATFKVCAI